MFELIDRCATGSSAGAALLVAHRGVIRSIADQLTGVAPVVELGSIQLLNREAPGAGWRVEGLDLVDHLAAVNYRAASA
jgi:broad specificity phosphatase PhoE